jgi:hypothetical protein
VAVQGPAIEFVERIIVPINVQVDPFGTASQTAQNTANVNQGAAAASGGAAAANGGTAVGGPAIAAAIAIGTQINIQVNACPSGVIQSALNAINVDQFAGAVGGDAVADGLGSLAIGGSATSLAIATIHQRNVQVATCR